MTYRYCSVDRDDGVLTVTINRPERRNALNRTASYELHQVFDEFEEDPRDRVAIVTGAGDAAFCAGADLRSEERSSTEEAVPPSGFGGLVARFHRSKPLIAAVNGFALGGGFEMALACDIIVASATATFGLPEPRVGLVAGSGGIQRLIRELGPKRAHAMILTGRRMAAADAYRVGLVDQVVPAEDLLPAARRCAEEIMACSPAAVRAVLAVADAADGLSVEESMRAMWELPAVQAVFTSPDAAEGPRAFAERRPPRWSELTPVDGSGNVR